VHARPRTLSKEVSLNEIKEESEYNPTPKTRGVTNNSSATRSSYKHPFIDDIIETPLPK